MEVAVDAVQEAKIDLAIDPIPSAGGEEAQPFVAVQGFFVSSKTENLLAATTAMVSLDPVSLAFGGVPSGSGQSRTLALTLGNLAGSAATYRLQVVDGSGGVAYSVSPGVVALDAGGSASVAVTAQAAVGATGPSQAVLNVLDAQGRVVAHAMLYTLMK